MRLTVDGTTPNGEPFTLVRTNRFASGSDISFGSVFEAGDDVWAIYHNRFTDVTIDQVRISTRLSPDDRQFSIARVERRNGGIYSRLTRSSVVRARAGTTVTLRVTLNSSRNEFGTKVVLLSIKVPAAPVGSGGSLRVGHGAPGGAATSFDGLLSKLASAPRNDQMNGEIDVFPANRHVVKRSSTRLVHDVFQGGRSFRFRIIR